MPCTCEECQAENERADLRFRLETLGRYRDDLTAELRQIDNELQVLPARLAIEDGR